LLLALERQVTSIAFPSVSTGVYRYPKPEAAAISSETIKQFLAEDRQIKEVRLVFFSEADARVFLDHQKFE